MWESRGISRARALVCILAAGFGVCYLTWRLTSTLNPAALWFAIILWAAELYGFVSSVLFYTAWNTRPRRPCVPPAPGISVDVMVPTYNEPEWVVRRTLIGALAVRYPTRHICSTTAAVRRWTPSPRSSASATSPDLTMPAPRPET
jgi:hypothetical protein